MRKRILLLFGILTVAAKPKTKPNENLLDSQVIFDFDARWVEFMRKAYGCPLPKDHIDWKLCVPKLGEVNYNEFLEVRRLAKKLFDLAEPPNKH